MKRTLIFISIMLLITASSYTQESFKKSLEKISTDLCSKMADKRKKKIVVLFITDINKAQTTIGKYMADVVSYHIVNNAIGFSVFDRENLSGITEAKKLMREGYIDVNKAKQLGHLLSVEAIVVGNYTVLSNSISLTLKALDVNDGFVIAQSMKDLPKDKDACVLLGIDCDSGINSSNRGFNNTPLNSNESYNNPETVNRECVVKNIGDFCFINRTKNKLTVRLGEVNRFAFDKGDLLLAPGETQCYYNYKSQSYKYITLDQNRKVRAHQGQILIEKCKSKTFILK